MVHRLQSHTFEPQQKKYEIILEGRKKEVPLKLNDLTPFRGDYNRVRRILAGQVR